jgi:hypothetical protein
MTAYTNIKYQTNISSSNDIASILGGAENPGFKYSANNVLNLFKNPEVYLDRLQVVSDSFITNYLSKANINFNNDFYIDIIFDEPSLIDGSIVIGFNFITDHMDLAGLIGENLSNIGSLNLLNDMTYPEIKLQYTDHELNDLIDLYNGSILSQRDYKNSIEGALSANRSSYLVKDSVNDFIDIAISNNSLNMPSMENLGVYFDKEKNITTYLNPIGIFNQVIADPVNGEKNDSNFAVVDTNPVIRDSTLNSIYYSNLSNIANNVISNKIVLIPEPILVKKLRLLIRSPNSFVCNISAFYIDDTIYSPTVYETESGNIDIIEQVNDGQNPINFGSDPKIIISDDEVKRLSAKLVWEGQLYSNVDDNLLYSLSKVNSSPNIDLSQAYIRGKNFEVSSIDSWFIDGENVLLESLKDSYCDSGDDEQNIKIMYVHNIGVSGNFIANDTIPEMTLALDVYNIDNIQSDFIKTIKFDTTALALGSYAQSLNQAFAQSFDTLEDGAEKLSTSTILEEYIYPGSNDAKITIDSGQDGSIEASRVLYSTQTVKFDPDTIGLFDITLDIPRYTDQNSPLELLPTSNFCQIGLHSNDLFDKDNFKILFTSQDSVNTFEDNTSFVLVFMAKGLGSFKDTIITHRITTIISESQS